MSRDPSRIQSIYVEFQVQGEYKKAIPSVMLDEDFKRPLLILDLQGPQTPAVQYLTMAQLKAYPRRARHKMLKRVNLGVPVQRMAQVIKAYPKLIGRRKCHGLTQSVLTASKIGQMQRTMNLRVHKGYLKSYVGQSHEPQTIISHRIGKIREILAQQGYRIPRIMVGTTQGGSRVWS